MKKKIGIVSLGCPKNLIDTEVMLGLLNKGGYEITSDETAANIIIVNTCGFIESAKQESINAILEMAEYKKSNCELLIVIGCLAERYHRQIREQIPEVDSIAGTGEYGNIVSIINNAYSGKKTELYGKLNEISYLENERILTENKGSAYIKIAEGCGNHCTYCIIPALRGRYRSRKIEDIVSEAKWLSDKGIKEIILVAQDTTKYGVDLYNEKKLPFLIRELSKIVGIEWIRVLYCYPQDVTEELIEEFASNKKLVKYIDIPIQHFSDKILKLMGRKETNALISNLIKMLRKRIPGIIIRTTLITGFPGEDAADHEIMIKNISSFRFDRLGVFVYSNEEGTPAFQMKNQVSKAVKNQRYHKLMSIQSKIAAELNMDRIDKIYAVLIEGISDDGIFYFGRSYAESPDIDGLIHFTSSVPLKIGTFADVKILNTEDYDLIGDVLYESAK
ncbi:MAG: 30S ribosomal protein S12 methylthiotransferase RimO [Clostridia bacterium]